MSRKRGAGGEFPLGPLLALIVGIAVAQYRVRNPRCKGCGAILEAIRLYEKVECPTCGAVLIGMQAALS